MPNYNPPANKITKEQYDYIAAHINDRPRVKVAVAAGVCMSTMYRVVRELNGEIDRSRSERHPDWWDGYILEHYPNESAQEIAEAIGSNKGRVNKIARELGVRHSEAFIAREKAMNVIRLKESWEKIDRKAQGEKWKRNRHLDEVRMRYGLPRRTRHRYSRIGRAAYQSRWCLISKYSYFVDDEDPYTLYHDDLTKRVNENYYTNKYGLKFEAADS